MGVASKNRAETPLSERLIKSAMGFLKYHFRGQTPPWKNLDELRKKAQPEDKQARKELRDELRRLIGESALEANSSSNPDALFRIGDENVGPFIMWCLCWPYDDNKGDLETILGLTRLLNFTLGGYNLKEYTELAKYADIWLEQARGNKTIDEVTKRQVREFLDDLLELLASTREENYVEVMEKRRNRQDAKTTEALTEMPYHKPTPEELAEETAQLNRRVAESWTFLRRNSLLESPDVLELQRRIDLFGKELKKLDRRLANRKRRNNDASLTDEEFKWQEETVKNLRTLEFDLHRRLYDNLMRRAMPEIDLILSAKSQLDWLRAEVEV